MNENVYYLRDITRSRKIRRENLRYFNHEKQTILDYDRHSARKFLLQCALTFELKQLKFDLNVSTRSKRFIVACYMTLHPALSVRQSVGRLVGWYKSDKSESFVHY